jgi:hypothetical protein
MRRSIMTAILALFLSATVAAGTACYGSFQTTSKLHAWNGDVTDNKFANWLIFVGLIVIPVYEIAVLADAVVFNSLEFWTGSNPMRAERIVLDRGEDGALRASRGDLELELRPGPGGAIDVYEDGVHRARAVRHDGGSISIYDPEGERLHHLDAEQVAARRATVAN